MRTLYTTVGSVEMKRQWKHFERLMFLREEGQVEMEEEVESDYTIHLVEHDGSPGLTNQVNQAINEAINLPNTSSQTENVTAVLNLDSIQSSPSSQANKRGRKRKTNAKASTNGTNGPACDQIIETSNFDQIMAPRNGPVSHNNYYPTQPLSEEEIFGHSIAASLKKFDAKQKEIVKLRLQEVIVQHLTDS